MPHDPKDENLEIILGQSQDIAVNTSDSRHHQLQPVFLSAVIISLFISITRYGSICGTMHRITKTVK